MNSALQPHGRTTWQLASTYLLIMLVMSLGFSVVIFQVSARELGRQLPPNRLLASQILDAGGVQDFFEQRIDEGRQNLIQNLLLLNLSVLAIGGLTSYILARRTLEPIEAALEAQARFASDAAHELRTPLAVMQAENEIALRNPRLELPRARELLASNLEEIGRLQAMSDTLLRLARSDGHAEALPLGDVDIAAETDSVVRTISPVAKQEKISIVSDVPALGVLGNAAALREVLHIVLDNAIKYSPEHTTITVAAQPGTPVQLTVTDEGQGIAADDLPRVFERFYRADVSRSKARVEGLGLGLPLARQLMHAMRGDITAVSEQGQGTTIHLTLPPAAVSADTQPSPVDSDQIN